MNNAKNTEDQKTIHFTKAAAYNEFLSTYFWCGTLGGPNPYIELYLCEDVMPVPISSTYQESDSFESPVYRENPPQIERVIHSRVKLTFDAAVALRDLLTQRIAEANVKKIMLDDDGNPYEEILL